MEIAKAEQPTAPTSVNLEVLPTDHDTNWAPATLIHDSLGVDGKTEQIDTDAINRALESSKNRLGRLKQNVKNQFDRIPAISNLKNAVIGRAKDYITEALIIDRNIEQSIGTAPLRQSIESVLANRQRKRYAKALISKMDNLSSNITKLNLDPTLIPRSNDSLEERARKVTALRAEVGKLKQSFPDNQTRILEKAIGEYESSNVSFVNAQDRYVAAKDIKNFLGVTAFSWVFGKMVRQNLPDYEKRNGIRAEMPTQPTQPVQEAQQDSNPVASQETAETEAVTSEISTEATQLDSQLSTTPEAKDGGSANIEQAEPVLEIADNEMREMLDLKSKIKEFTDAGISLPPEKIAKFIALGLTPADIQAYNAYKLTKNALTTSVA